MCLWNTIHNVPFWAILTHIFDLWPWRMTLTFHPYKCAAPRDTHECQMSSCYLQYCKNYDFDPYILPLTLNDDIDHDHLPLKMCSSMRYTCMPNVKLLSSILQKLWLMLKFVQTYEYYEYYQQYYQQTNTLTGQKQ